MDRSLLYKIVLFAMSIVLKYYILLIVDRLLFLIGDIARDLNLLSLLYYRNRTHVKFYAVCLSTYTLWICKSTTAIVHNIYSILYSLADYNYRERIYGFQKLFCRTIIYIFFISIKVFHSSSVHFFTNHLWSKNYKIIWYTYFSEMYWILEFGFFFHFIQWKIVIIRFYF